MSSTSPDREPGVLEWVRGNRPAARIMIDVLSDLTNSPLTFVKCLTRDEIWKQVESDWPAGDRPANAGDLVALIEEAECNAEAMLRRFSSEDKKWRPLFDRLEQVLIHSGSRRQEPVEHLLSDHWAWRWLDLIGIVSGLLLERPTARILQWQHELTNGLLSSQLLRLPGIELSIWVGPLRLRAAGRDYEPGKWFKQAAETLYGCLAYPQTPLHSFERLSQYYFSRPSYSIEEQESACTTLLRALEFLSLSTAPAFRDFDIADVQALSLFSFMLAELPAALHREKIDLHNVLISARIDRLASEERSHGRAIAFTGSVTRCSGTLSIVEQKDHHYPPRQVYTQSRDVILGAEAELRLEKLIADLLEDRRVASGFSRAQQYLEELLLIRYRMSENFGVLAVNDESHAPDSPDRELGRRIAREICDIMCSSTAVIYRYDYLKQALVMVGAHIDDPAEKPVSDAAYDWMTGIAANEQRQKSVSYHAADHNRAAVFQAWLTAEGLVDRMATQANPPPESPVSSAQAILAVPIRVFGRVWGVVEVLSPHKNWFDVPGLVFFQRLADLVGPYYHEHLLMRLLYSIADASGDADDKPFNRLAHQLREMTLSDACCIWLVDSIDADEFNLMGCSGRDLKPWNPESSEGARSHRPSIARTLIAKRDVWFAGRIGSGDLSDAWLAKPNTQTLVQDGFHFLAVLPIYRRGSHEAFISLYSKSSEFRSGWKSWGRFIAGYVGVVIDRILNVRKEEYDKRQLIAHELGNATRVALASAENLFRALESKFTEAQLPDQFYNWKSDIRSNIIYAREITCGPEEGDTSPHDEWDPNISFLAKLNLKRIINSGPISLRAEIKAALQPLQDLRRRKSIELIARFPYPDVVLNMNEDALRIICVNLFGNAMKYAIPGAILKYEVTKQPFGGQLQISNLGEPLASGENDLIFDRGFRGRKTRGTVAGSGLGLFIVKKICAEYGIAIDYDSRKAGPDSPHVWHEFTLAFPTSRIVRFVQYT